MLDLQWKALTQVFDGLTKAFTLDFVALAASLAFIGSLQKDPLPANAARQEAIVYLIIAFSVLAGVALVLSVNAFNRGIRRVDRTLSLYSDFAYNELRLKQYFSSAGAFAFYGGLIGCAMLVLIVFVALRLR